ncbi:MAG: DNA repair protein RecN [Bacteroidales bacterium]
MLKHLFIENYALIDRLDIGFAQGFTAITGETGAGKSILMDALDLVLGKRADTQILSNPDRKCVVEGTFHIANYHLHSFFEETGLDYDNDTVLRREIYPNGKTRAFINDTPVNLTILKALGDKLIDIHAQHATTSLQDPGFQLSVIDNYAGLESELFDYQLQFHLWQKNVAYLNELREKEKSGRSAYDFKLFLLEELMAAKLAADEQEILENRQSLLAHAEEIKNGLHRVTEILGQEERGMITSLVDAEGTLKKVSAYYSGLEDITGRVSSNLIDLKDIYQELNGMLDGLDVNPDELYQVQQRLDMIYRLQRKHQVNTIQELLDMRDSLHAELEDYSSLEEQIVQQEQLINGLFSDISSRAVRLTGARIAVFPSLEKEIVTRLRHMGMPECQFEIRHQEETEPGLLGRDVIGFYFNANKGYSPKPLADIASGGELSRVMLSIKSIVSEKTRLPTIVFDEIDNGISGDIAGRVGDVLAAAAVRMQVIVITHLPQIAGKATHQFTVYKELVDSITYSQIKLLNSQERVTELAKMIGGKDTSPASVAAARELLETLPEVATE